MCDKALLVGIVRLCDADLYKRTGPDCVPVYLLDRVEFQHAAQRRKRHHPIEWKEIEGHDVICTEYDTSLLEKEREQVKYIFEKLVQKANHIHKEEDNDTQYDIKNLDAILGNVRISNPLSEEEIEDLKLWKAGKVANKEGKPLTNVVGDPTDNTGSIFKSLFHQAYSSEVGCQYIDSSEPEEEEDDDFKMGDGSGSGSGSGSSIDSEGFPPIKFDGGKRRGKRTRRKRRRKKKTRRKNKRRKKTKRRRRKRKNSRRKR